jgi:hypothetical protein
MGEVRNVYKVFFGKPEGMNHSEDIDKDRSIILKQGNRVKRLWIGFIWLRIGACCRLL